MGTDPRLVSPLRRTSGLTDSHQKHRCDCLRDLRHLRRHPRDGRKSHGRDGIVRLSRLGLEIQGRSADCECPGLPVQPDNMMETLLYLLYQVAGLAPIIPLDDQLRPTWLFGKTVHEGCDRAGYYEQADFAKEYGSPKCLVKIGCWGPVVNCNVTKRGWMDGSVVAQTSVGFASAAPCRDSPTNSCLSWMRLPDPPFDMVVGMWGGVLRGLRAITNRAVNKEPKVASSARRNSPLDTNRNFTDRSRN